MNRETENACTDFLYYHQEILHPAAEEFNSDLSSRKLRLHHAIQTNTLAAHALDYLMAIRASLGLRDPLGRKERRSQLVKEFDKEFAVEGARILNRKFQLVDAVNNAIKHITLDSKRYGELVGEYGRIGVRCLRDERGLVLFEVESFRFDFGRVVLRPVLDVVAPPSFDGVEHVADFATGRFAGVIKVNDYNDDPIDQMIEYCNPKCLDCDEPEDGCRCTEFLYAGEQGEFRPSRDEGFDFDKAMAMISGAYTND